MTQVCYASTLFGAMTLATAADAGLLGERGERRLLIVSSNVPIPELAAGFEDSHAFAALREHFDDIVRWNDVIAPLHPSQWLPSAEELPMLSRLVTERLDLTGGVSELVVESIAVAPAAAIASLLRDCPITVYADGLLSYSPTRTSLRPGIGRRIRRLLYLDLVPAVTPLLLREYDVEPVALPALTETVATLPVPEIGDAAGCPVILGQYLAQLGILPVADETGLYLRMLRALAARGESRVVFRPHPSVARTHSGPLRDEAERLGVDLVVATDGMPAEAWFAAARPSLVVSCFSTALLTAARHHGLEVASLGTEVVLEELTPYENSNRIPVTLVDATVPRLQADGTVTSPPATDVRRLVDAVAYCMQADRLPDLRAAAVDHLAEHGHARYFKKRRLEKLGLIAPAPAKPEPSPAPVTVGRVARRLFAEARTVADRRRGTS